MYQKILVPLDKSKEAEGVLPLVRENLIAEGEVILLHIIPPGRTKALGEILWYADQQERENRNKAMEYLRDLVDRMGVDPGRWRCAVAVAGSVANGIATFAATEGVDLIVMYTHDRKGLAKLIRGSIAEKVSNTASIDVQVFKPRELVVAS